MLLKIPASLLVLLLYFVPGVAQTVYHFSYRLPAAADTSLHDLFFVRFDNGTGIARLRLRGQANDSAGLLEMQAQEEYPVLTDKNTDLPDLYFKLSNPVIKAGPVLPLFVPPVIVFKKGVNGSGYEPFGLSAGTGDTAVIPFITNELMADSTLEKDFVLQYFSKNDAFYKNMFGIRSRGLTATENNTKIILLAVTNVNDPSIGPSCAKDGDRIVQTFHDLADFLDIGFEPTVIAGDNYNKEAVQLAVKALHPSGNDIVVFYYSGHGFRKPKDKSNPFPYIDMRPTPDNTYMLNSLSLMNDIFVNIRAKGARLNLVISDCCNTDPGKINSTGSPITKLRGFQWKWSEQNCRNLFLNPVPLSIIVTAARPDEEASSNNDFGGFFSYFFKSAMENYFSFFKQDASWDQVLQEAARQTVIKAQHTYCSKPYINSNICRQTPVYKVF